MKDLNNFFKPHSEESYGCKNELRQATANF